MKRFSFLLACALAFIGAMTGSLLYLNVRENLKVSENDSPLLHLSETLPIMSPTTKMTAPASNQKPSSNIVATPVKREGTPVSPKKKQQIPLKVDIKHPSQPEVLPKQKSREEELREIQAQIKPKKASKENVVSLPVVDDILEEGQKLKESIEEEAKETMQGTLDFIPGIDAEISDAELDVRGDKIGFTFTIPADRVKLIGELPPEEKKAKVVSDDVVSDDVASCDISSKDRK